MKRLYQECSEFGEYNVFDTDTGVLMPVSLEEFNSLKALVDPANIFNGNSKTHTFFPRRIYFQITRRCNLSCPYCFIKADQFEKDLPEDVIMNIIPYLSKNGLMEVRLTGGEPTLLKHFQKVVESFRNHNVYVSVATNGLWSEEILNYFCSKPDLWLIVSIDGDKKAHNTLRANSYDKITNNLVKLRLQNKLIRIRLNTVLTRDNVNTMESVFVLAKRIEAESITFIPLRPQVRDSKIRHKMLTSNEFQLSIKKMIELKQKYGINFTTTIETIYKHEIMPDKIEDERVRKPFLAGSFPFDQLKKLATIWQDDSRWIFFRNLDYKSSECNECNYYRVSCTGSCPIQNLDLSILDIKEDVAQQLFKQLQKNGEWYCYKSFM